MLLLIRQTVALDATRRELRQANRTLDALRRDQERRNCRLVPPDPDGLPWTGWNVESAGPGGTVR